METNVGETLAGKETQTEEEENFPHTQTTHRTGSAEVAQGRMDLRLVGALAGHVEGVHEAESGAHESS